MGELHTGVSGWLVCCTCSGHAVMFPWPSLHIVAQTASQPASPRHLQACISEVMCTATQSLYNAFGIGLGGRLGPVATQVHTFIFVLAPLACQLLAVHGSRVADVSQ